jgi:hypothetical protein
VLRDLLRTKSGKRACEEFVRGQRGIRSLIGVSSSEQVRSELYRLERNGVSVARRTVKEALRKF